MTITTSSSYKQKTFISIQNLREKAIESNKVHNSLNNIVVSKVEDNDDNTIFSIPMNLIQTFIEISDIRIEIREIVYRRIKIM